MPFPLASRSLRFPARLVALLLVAVSPAFASWFSKDKPIPDWGLEAAKTHTPDYAKDAAAVVLFDEYVETIDAQGRAVERERDAMRILKPQGRHDGVCGVSYDVDEKINYFRAWTIAADEKQYQAQDTDFTDVGDTGIPIMLSTRKDARRPSPRRRCRRDHHLRVRRAAWSPISRRRSGTFRAASPSSSRPSKSTCPPGRAHSEAWHRFQPVKPVEVAPNHWRWELKDMPALDLREVHAARPEWQALAARMSVQWGDAAVEGKDNQWRAIGQWVTTLEANRPDPSPEITAQTQSLIAGAPDFYTKLSRITEYIQKNIRYFIVDARHRRLAGQPRRRHLPQPLRRLQRQDHSADLHAPGGRHPRLLCARRRPPRRRRSR